MTSTGPVPEYMKKVKDLGEMRTDINWFEEFLDWQDRPREGPGEEKLPHGKDWATRGLA